MKIDKKTKYNSGWFKKGFKHTEETKRKMSITRKGVKRPPFSEEWKRKISKNSAKIWKGKKLPMETRRKISLAKKGIKLSEKHKKHLSESHKGHVISKETRIKMSLSHKGTGISQITYKRYYHLNDMRYKEWRTAVFSRDNWTCQTCGKRGCYLEPHHIKGWSKYPELRYVVENGVTLCYECHILTRKKILK